jgi:carbon-monoxide dehydrogenase medium subunit
MIPAAFDYVRPKSLASAIEHLEADPDGSKLLAGGHTLIPTLKLRLASPSVLIVLNGIAELRGIGVDRDRIKIGALTTHADLLSSDELHKTLPIFREAATVIADPQVRNRGTIGGSLANADPAADWPAIAIALQAEFDIAGPKGSRRLAARDFFIDIFTTALEPCEVLTGIHVKRTDPNTRFSYRKICHPAC